MDVRALIAQSPRNFAWHALKRIAARTGHQAERAVARRRSADTTPCCRSLGQLDAPRRQRAVRRPTESRVSMRIFAITTPSACASRDGRCRQLDHQRHDRNERFCRSRRSMPSVPAPGATGARSRSHVADIAVGAERPASVASRSDSEPINAPRLATTNAITVPTWSQSGMSDWSFPHMASSTYPEQQPPKLTRGQVRSSSARPSR